MINAKNKLLTTVAILVCEREGIGDRGCRHRGRGACWRRRQELQLAAAGARRKHRLGFVRRRRLPLHRTGLALRPHGPAHSESNAVG